MTFEQILLLYIYRHKKISLNLFGTIELHGVVPEPEILKKEKQLPVEGLTFEFSPHVATDEDFVLFYASEKGRIIPLSASDIEAQLLMARQIVNIGNPFEIVGLGKIVKMDNGKLTMIPGYYSIPPISGSGRPPVLRERVQNAPAPRVEKDKEKGDKKIEAGPWLAISGILAAVVLVIWIIFSFVLPMMKTTQPPQETTVLPSETDTTTLPPVQDTLVSNPAPLVPDTLAILSWKAYIAKFSKQKVAEDRLNKLKTYGHNVSLEKADTNRFFIYVNLQSSISDTSRQRDSLAKFFAYPVKLEPLPPQQ